MDSKSIVGNLFQGTRQNDDNLRYQAVERDDVRSLQIETLIPSKINRDLDDEFVEELANNIRMNGLMQYPVVRPAENGCYTILAGHHRVAACKKLNKEDGSYPTIRCLIKRFDDLDSELLLLDTNLKINTLSTYDRMMAIGRKEELLKEKKKCSKTKGGNLKNIIAEESDLKRSQVQTYLTIYKKTCPEVKDALKHEQITLSQAAALSHRSDDDQKKAIMRNQDGVTKKKVSKDQFQKALANYVTACHSLDNILQKRDESELTPQERDLKKFVHEMARFLSAQVEP